MNKTKDVLYHIIRLSESENPDKVLKRTKLIKMLYLVYRESILDEDYDGNLPNLTFINYHYGPYSDKVLDSINEANEEHLFHEYSIQTEKGQIYTYEICNCPVHSVDSTLTDEEIQIVKSVFDQYSDFETRDIVELVISLPELDEKPKYSTIKPREIS